MALMVPLLALPNGSSVANAYVRVQIGGEVRHPSINGGERTLNYRAMRRHTVSEIGADGQAVTRENWYPIDDYRQLFPVDADAPLHAQLYAHLLTDPVFAEAVPA